MLPANLSRAFAPALAALALAGTPAVSSAGSFADDVAPSQTVQGRDGNFFGMALEGGRSGGFLYELTPAGRFHYLHLFPVDYPGNTPMRQGTSPEGGLTVGQDGALYGSTRDGGVFGNGVIFKVDRRGAFTNLFHFESGGGYKGGITITRNGDLFAGLAYSYQVVRLSRDGSHSQITVLGLPESLAETANGDVLLATGDSTGGVWRYNADTDQFDALAGLADPAFSLVPLADGSVLCLTSNALLQISAAGDVTTVHQFDLEFQGLNPNFIMVETDGSYLGTTAAGGLERSGTVFRIVPSTGEYTVVSHFPSPGPYGANWDWFQGVFPLRVAGLSGDRPPMAQDDIVDAALIRPDPQSPGSPASAVIPVLRNDSDADRNRLTIVSVGAATNGTASLDFIAQKVTYTANSEQASNDSFSYTVVDGSGGTATGHVIIRTNPAGIYSGTVAGAPDPSTGNPGPPAVTIKVRVNRGRSLGGSVNFFGKNYRIAGAFNEANQFAALLESHPNAGTYSAVQLWLRPNGAGWTVEATLQKDGLSYSASCLPAN